jgi:hypothetical protein
LPYQRNVSIDEYEIILMNNGSAKMLDEPTRKISPNLNYVYLLPGESSPGSALAMNRGVALSRAPMLCLIGWSKSSIDRVDLMKFILKLQS